MLRIDSKNQAVQKTAAFGGRLVEQPIHRRRQPDHAQMVGKGGHGGNRLAVDAAKPLRRRLVERRRDAGAKRGQTKRSLHFRRNRPGAIALAEGDLFGSPRPVTPEMFRELSDADAA